MSRYLIAMASVTAAVGALVLLRAKINPTTVALAMTLVILFIATFVGSGPAFLGSMIAVLGFNYFFLPPIGTLTIADPQNWVALFAFLIVALTAGQLSSLARQRAEEAEARRREIERLYSELKEAFEQASQAEALRRSEKLKSALLDAVTHDIRTPLTSIKASVTTLLGNGIEGTKLDEQTQREMLLVIDEECDRLNSYTEKMLKMARIEAGELRLHRRWEAPEELIEAALKRARSVTTESRINLAIHDELPLVLVDSHAISEVVFLLIDNAAKYSPPDKPIRIEGRYLEDQWIEIAVEDEGPSIPVELRERVFDRFFRLNEGGTSGKGIGMGLAIARGIIEAHGGRIWIETGSGGVGTRVVFRLPIGDDEDAVVAD